MADDDPQPTSDVRAAADETGAELERFGGEPTEAELAGDPHGGAAIVRANVVLTAVFTVSAVIAAVVFSGAARAQGVVVALTLFGAGVVAFLVGYFTAVGRSRTQELAVAELYLLLGPAIPRHVKRTMLGALGVQIVVALATSLARPNTDGRAGSTLAFGVLVPMLGLGLNGLWSARYGTFGPRRRRAPEPATDAGRAADDHDDVPPEPDEMD